MTTNGTCFLIPNTDCTAPIQAALDAGNRITCPDPGPGNYYGITSLAFKKSGTALLGESGAVTLKYLGTGAAAAKMLVVDKAAHNGGSNYKDLLIDGFVLDGDNKALRGLDFNGFTRRCRARNLYITNCVNPLTLQDGFYSSWENVEFGTTPFSTPSGMASGTYSANLFGAWLDTCHAASFKNCIFDLIGGDATHAYTAALRVGLSDAVRLDSVTFESMTSSVHKLASLFLIAGQVTLKISSIYIESVDCVNELIQLADNCAFDSENVFLNGVSATSFLKAASRAPVRIGTLDGENVAFPKIFALSSGTEFTNLSVDRISLGVGAQTGSIFDANTTATTKQGASSDPILLENAKAATVTGYVTSGYTPSLGSNFVDVSSGTAVINGQAVGSTKNSSVAQRLMPDLTAVATWNVKISPAGTAYIEKQTAIRPESTFALTIATFTTAGGGAAPAGLSVPIPSRSRLVGAIIDSPKTPNFMLNRALRGHLSLTSGVLTNLLSMILSNVSGEDDFLGLELEYVASTTSGATRSCETGRVAVAFSVDNGGNYKSSSVVKFGNTQSLDAGMSSWTLVFAAAIVSNQLAVQVTSTTSTGDTARIEFTAVAKGGVRSMTGVALAAAATAAE
jgi:hypothetical protein